MLLRSFLPVVLFIGALALMGSAFTNAQDYTDPPDKTAVRDQGPPAGKAAPAASGSEVRQAPPRGDSDTAPAPGYFERARMLLYLLRSRHWRKSAHHEAPQAEAGT